MGRRSAAVMASLLLLLAIVFDAGQVTGQPQQSGDSALPYEREAAAGAPQGELLVQGRRVRGTSFLTPDPVEQVIERHRAAFAAAPVDLFEQALPDGRLLSVLDVPGDRHLVVAAKRRSGATEVVRGWSALGAAPAALPALPLPAGWPVLSLVEDRLGAVVQRTADVAAPLAPPAARAALDAHLRAAGWQHEEELLFRRGGVSLQLGLLPGAPGTRLQLRLREEPTTSGERRRAASGRGAEEAAERNLHGTATAAAGGAVALQAAKAARESW